MPEYTPSPAAQPAQGIFHCRRCHLDFRDLTNHNRTCEGYPMENGCEVQQCRKWLREHPQQPPLQNPGNELA
jgi:hypothetical protein